MRAYIVPRATPTQVGKLPEENSGWRPKPRKLDERMTRCVNPMHVTEFHFRALMILALEEQPPYACASCYDISIRAPWAGNYESSNRRNENVLGGNSSRIWGVWERVDHGTRVHWHWRHHQFSGFSDQSNPKETGPEED